LCVDLGLTVGWGANFGYCGVLTPLPAQFGWGTIPTKVAVTTTVSANKVDAFILDLIPVTVDPYFAYNRYSEVHFDTDSSKSTSFNFQSIGVYLNGSLYC